MEVVIYERNKYQEIFLPDTFNFRRNPALLVLRRFQCRRQPSRARSNCQVLKPLIIIKLISNGKKLPELRIILYITKKPEAVSGLK